MKKTRSNLPAVIWNGFNYKWKKWPHRLSVLGSVFNLRDTNGDNIPDTIKHEKHIKIGHWPKDEAIYKVPYSSIYTEQIFIGKGTLHSIRLNAIIEEGISVKKRVQVRLKDLYRYTPHFQRDLTQKDKLRILLNGFYLKSINNPSGWHFGGIGIDLINLGWIDPQHIYFDVVAYIRPARSPELIAHGNRGWNQHKKCVYDLRIDYVLIGGDKTDIAFTRRSFSKKTREVARLGAVFDRYHITGIQKPQFTQACLGLTGFYLIINPPRYKQKNRKKTGRYIKELGISVQNLIYDQDTGIAYFHLEALFSNECKILFHSTYGFTFDTQVKVCLIQLSQNAKIEEGQVSGSTKKSVDNKTKWVDFVAK